MCPDLYLQIRYLLDYNSFAKQPVGYAGYAVYYVAMNTTATKRVSKYQHIYWYFYEVMLKRNHDAGLKGVHFEIML